MKTNRIEFRTDDPDYNRIKLLAKMYAGGDMTKWITYASLNCKRKNLCKKK